MARNRPKGTIQRNRGAIVRRAEGLAVGMDNFSAHQQKIIKRNYNNLDTIQLQKLAETVTDLYLAEGKKVEKLWKSAVGAMQKLEVPQQRIDLLVKSQNLEQLAKLVKELQETG